MCSIAASKKGQYIIIPHLDPHNWQYMADTYKFDLLAKC